MSETRRTQTTVTKFSHQTEDELIRKLTATLNKLGYVVTKASPERITVGALAKLVNRNVTNVRTRLRSPHCPPFVHAKGKCRILWLELNEPLLAYLRTAYAGQRRDLANRK